MTEFCANFYISFNFFNILNPFHNCGQRWLYWKDYKIKTMCSFNTVWKELTIAIQEYHYPQNRASIIALCSNANYKSNSPRRYFVWGYFLLKGTLWAKCEQHWTFNSTSILIMT